MDIPDVDRFLIDLNLCGAQYCKDGRFRFECFPTDSDGRWYIAICVNTRKTPYRIENSEILKGDEVLAYLKNFEKDVIELSYFRKNGKVMTLNSNQRRFCSGCKFCGVSQQESRYLASLLDRDLLEAYFEELSQTCNFEDLEEIALCTGCFPKEKYLIEHLYDIHDVASEHGFGGEIKFIGSELSRDGLKEIARKIPDFSYYFTIEVFTNRDIFLNPKKRVPLDEIERTLQFAKNQGFDTSFLYIIGLEPLEIYERGLRRFKKDVTRFPVINIFQNYHKEQEKHRVGKTLDYYLKARKIAESVFEDTDLKPRVWECYRSLWYSEYRGEKLDYDLQTFESGY